MSTPQEDWKKAFENWWIPKVSVTCDEIIAWIEQHRDLIAEIEWISPQHRLPENTQECAFVVTATQQVLEGVFYAPLQDHAPGFLGYFRTVDGIGFNVWQQNDYEVSLWKPKHKYNL